MPCRMDALAIGSLAAITARTGSFSPGRSWAMLAAGIAGCTVLLHYRAPSFRDAGVRSIGFTVIAFTCGALLRVALSKRASPLGMVLCWSPLRYVGRIAYGMYLLQDPAHDAANWALSRWFAIPGGSSTDFMVTLAVTIAAASFSWFAFESVTQRRVQAILMRHGLARRQSA